MLSMNMIILPMEWNMIILRMEWITIILLESDRMLRLRGSSRVKSSPKYVGPPYDDDK